MRWPTPCSTPPSTAAIELGYFEEEGIDLSLVNGGGADKVMTAMISGDADIGFMGSEASIYVYQEGSEDYAVNFAQLTQRAGNFLVSRNPEPDFQWADLKGTSVLGGRAAGMPQMVFEYILKKNGLDPKTDLSIDQSISFGLTAAAFPDSGADYTVEFEPFATALEQQGQGYVVASLGVDLGLRALHRLLRQAQLHGGAPGDHPGLHQCHPERPGVRQLPLRRGDRRGHPSPVPGK